MFKQNYHFDICLAFINYFTISVKSNSLSKSLSRFLNSIFCIKFDFSNFEFPSTLAWPLSSFSG